MWCVYSINGWMPTGTSTEGMQWPRRLNDRSTTARRCRRSSGAVPNPLNRAVLGFATKGEEARTRGHF